MTAETASAMQIELYRRMTGEQRLKIALDLHEMSCNVAREGIRRQHPDASEAEVESYLRARIEHARVSGGLSGNGRLPSFEHCGDPIRVIDTASPGSTSC